MNTAKQFISIIFLILASQIIITVSQPVLACPHCNATNGNYTRGSSYRKNLETLLNMISSNTRIKNGFYKFSVGQDPDRVNGIALCRADHSPSDCQSLLKEATTMLLDDCPVQKEAIGYYFGGCMLRYSNRPIFDSLDNSLSCTVSESQQRITDHRKLKQSLADLLDELKHRTSAGNSSYKFSSDYVEVTTSYNVYGLAQCNPDLSSVECSDCLQEVISNLLNCCSTLNGAGTYGPVCSLEFANYPLIDSVNNASVQPIPPAGGSGERRIKSGNNRSSAYKRWIIVVGVMSFVLIAILLFGLSKKNKRKKQDKERTHGGIKLVDSLQLDFDTIRSATDNFAEAKRLNNGNATAIYKGVLPDGQEIVVKRLDKGGRDDELEFDNEVLLSANLQHKNLVKLLGFCIEKDQRILAYEFHHNGSLHDILVDPIKRARLDWQTRFHIISGFARGLLYLHEDSQVPVIHRDLKPNNILLNALMDPKISNFSRACLVHADQTRGDTGVVGTNGYMPLEYVKHGHPSIKSDVFSYGVILLEIISGHTIARFSENEEESLPTYAWKKMNEDTILDIVDEALPNVMSNINQIKRCIKIGLACVQEDPRLRPNMSVVVLMLTSDTIEIHEPTRPSPVVINIMEVHSNSHHHIIHNHSSHETSINEISYSCLDPR